MADTIIPAFKISGTQAIIVALYVFVIFGAGHLLALSFPQAKASKVWLSLGF